MLEYRKISDEVVPIWLAEGTSKPSSRDEPVGELFKLVRKESTMPEYRGVKLSKLGQILTTGVDVEPTTSPIYVGAIDKAWEYPSMYEPRAVYALRSKMLRKSYRTLPRDAPPEQIAEARQDYPHMHETPRSLWLSRFENTHPGYEMDYGYWVPGNAKEALIAIFIFGADRSRALAAVNKALAEWRDAPVTHRAL